MQVEHVAVWPKRGPGLCPLISGLLHFHVVVSHRYTSSDANVCVGRSGGPAPAVRGPSLVAIRG